MPTICSHIMLLRPGNEVSADVIACYSTSGDIVCLWITHKIIISNASEIHMIDFETTNDTTTDCPIEYTVRWWHMFTHYFGCCQLVDMSCYTPADNIQLQANRLVYTLYHKSNVSQEFYNISKAMAPKRILIGWWLPWYKCSIYTVHGPWSHQDFSFLALLTSAISYTHMVVIVSFSQTNATL